MKLPDRRPEPLVLRSVTTRGVMLPLRFELSDGNAVTPDRPGLGMVWDEARIRRLEAL